ncbi:MAG: hypothetical protein F6K48_15830 [Okeania sp. SIO3H1]|uniref:hypothetical protein n=1 Tax=Okeania sp. SIO1I7 TaxID=2607772 RepID=UPI0013C880E8|nr:hypothetical protein [Okeania sp. SIO1I7]NEN90298.1 hypothetical protein [Okeania sp. SIO3H1]NET29755.1 hypothetical protein [Okeania sp. SIO1I7]
MSSSPKTNRDHAKNTQRPMMEDEAVEALVKSVVVPQENYYPQLRLRDLDFQTPLMIVVVLTLLSIQ